MSVQIADALATQPATGVATANGKKLPQRRWEQVNQLVQQPTELYLPSMPAIHGNDVCGWPIPTKTNEMQEPQLFGGHRMHS